MPDADLDNRARTGHIAIRSAWHKSCLSERSRDDEESSARMGDCPPEIPKIFADAVIRVTFVTFFVTAVVRRAGRKRRLRMHSRDVLFE
jgi:hypothetical protein